MGVKNEKSIPGLNYFKRNIGIIIFLNTEIFDRFQLVESIKIKFCKCHY